VVEDEQAHLISVFGNDSDVGTITAAVHEKATFAKADSTIQGLLSKRGALYVLVRGAPPIRQRKGEWMGHGAWLLSWLNANTPSRRGWAPTLE
jgi:hypothetical protein